MERNENASTPRMLPTMRFNGEEYFVDAHLREFRTKTPPIRPIEFIRFDSEQGRQMLSECEVLTCRHCGQTAVVPQNGQEAAVVCTRCGCLNEK